jgi:hypothetical protein
MFAEFLKEVIEIRLLFNQSNAPSQQMIPLELDWYCTELTNRWKGAAPASTRLENCPELVVTGDWRQTDLGWRFT